MRTYSLIDELLLQPTRNVQKYPLTDISYDKKTNIVFVEVALAGFSKDDVSVRLENGNLVISSAGVTAEEDDIEYVQKDIAFRSFERVIKLHEKYSKGKVNATFENGLLTVMIAPSEDYSTLIEIK